MPKAKKATKVVNRVSPIVSFKKEAKEDALPKQAATILSIVQSARSLTVAELQKRMTGKVETQQEMSSIWGFYRSKLIAGGYIKVERPKAAKAAPKAKKQVVQAA